MSHLEVTLEDRLIAGYSALAISVYVLESLIPSPLLGIKPGLSNSIVIWVLLRHSWSMAAWVALLRVGVGSLLTGTFLAPAFILSGSGTISSLFVLWWARFIPGIGAVGYSVLAAFAHTSAQFFIAYQLFIPHPGLGYLLPPLLTSALIFGCLNGLLVVAIARQENNSP